MNAGRTAAQLLDDDLTEIDLSDDLGASMELDGAMLTEMDDGGAVIDFSAIRTLDSDPVRDHDANLAAHMDERDLNAVAERLCEAVDQDIESRQDWEGQLAEGLKLLGLKIEDRQFPFKGASGAVDPMLTEAILRGQANANAELIPAAGPVKTQLIGASSTQRDDKARRVKDWMNLYLTKLAPEYYPDYSQMLFWWYFAGSTFKKVYQHPLLRRPVSPFIRADEFVVSYDTKSLYDCPRMTHISKMSRRQVRALQLTGFWRDIPMVDSGPDQQDSILESAIDQATGVYDPNNSSLYNGDEDFKLYESHVDLDLKDFEHRLEGSDTPSGLPLPYRVTLDPNTKKVLAIYRNWKQNDPAFLKQLQFVHYKLLQGPGFYGLGMCHVLGNSAKAGTSLVRQIIDGNTLNMFPGGLKQKGLRIEENSLMIGPCQFVEIDTAGMPINQAFMPMPYKEVSPVSLATLQHIQESGRRLSGATEIAVGEGRQDAPVGTTIALLEAANKIETQMVKFGHQALKEELGLIKGLFGQYLPDEPYPFPVRGGMSTIMRSDFSDEIDVIPVSDPNITSSAQRLVMAQGKLTMGLQAPPGTHNVPLLYRQVYEAMGMPDDQISAIMPPPQQAQPLDPLTENGNAMMNMPLKAGLEQDHRAHIEVHKALAEMPAMQAHIAEHMAMQMRVDVQRVLAQRGIQLPPPGQKLPPEIENQIAIAIAGAMKVLEQERGGPEPTAAQIAMQDLAIKDKRADDEFKVGMAKVAENRYKTDVQADEKAADRKSREEIEILRAAANVADNMNPPEEYVRNIVKEGRDQSGV